LKRIIEEVDKDSKKMTIVLKLNAKKLKKMKEQMNFTITSETIRNALFLLIPVPAKIQMF